MSVARYIEDDEEDDEDDEDYDMEEDEDELAIRRVTISALFNVTAGDIASMTEDSIGRL